jgi:hypothetical protein
MKFKQPSNGRRIFCRTVGRNGKLRVLDLERRQKMKFEPKSAQEVAALDLLRAGVYRLRVSEAYDKVSKASGSEMTELKLPMIDRNGLGKRKRP